MYLFKPGEDKDVAWSKIPDLPMRYHINYQLLDGDDNGRPAKTKDLTAGEFVRNKAFNHLSPSGLYLIANSPFNDVSISGPHIFNIVILKTSIMVCCLLLLSPKTMSPANT